MKLVMIGLSFLYISLPFNSAKADGLHIKLIATYFDLAFSNAGTEANKRAALANLNSKCVSWGGVIDRESVDVLSGNAYQELLAAACLHH